MSMKNKQVVAIIAVLATVALGSLFTAARLYRQVRILEGQLTPVAKAVPAAPVRAAEPTRSGDDDDAPPPVSNPQHELKVLESDYDGQTTVLVRLSERPDMTGIRQYVVATPLNQGFVGISYRAEWMYKYRTYVPTLVITGDFAFRTNVVVCLRKGLARYGKAGNPGATGSLAEDFVFTVQRKDLPPEVDFADKGRYLPPCGARTVGIASVNTPSVATEVRRVEPGNLLQLLAREERQYRHYYGEDGDSCDTVELSGEVLRQKFICKNRVNVKETIKVPVRSEDGGPSNGVFLVSVGSGEKPFCERYYHWNCTACNQPNFRLVSVSDLGLSVRRHAGGLGVWVTSLMTGRPVNRAKVEVYTKSNVKIFKGETGHDGWCVPARVQKGEPFAVIVRAADGSDLNFMALSDRMQVGEGYVDGARAEYLKDGEVSGFSWTERGIYRHDEKIFYHLILRNGAMKAPKPMPVVVRLQDSDNKLLAERTFLSDESGAVECDDFSVPADQPSGCWHLVARLPGKDGAVLADREVKVEEFAPPQIRVAVQATEKCHPSNFTFAVSAEHLFGGPATALNCEGAVVFEDAPFAPAAWKGYFFGSEDRKLKPSYRELSPTQVLDDRGRTVFQAPIWADSGLPRAMVRATGQGVVIEDGGRTATSRDTALLHYYPYYIGSSFPSWLRKPMGKRNPKLTIACVTPEGRRLAESKRLTVRLERVNSIYSYRENDNGTCAWDCEHVRELAADDFEVVSKVDADTEIELPLQLCGDYVVTVTDPATSVSYARAFYLSDWGDSTVRAPLANPTEVTLRADKASYRVGESPRLVVKSPFAGYAMVSVQRERERYTEILELTNATSEVVLRPVAIEDSPNLDVYVSVVQSVEKNAGHLAVRAHGQTTIRVMPKEHELPVTVEAEVKVKVEGQGQQWCVDSIVDAPGAEAVVVTVVDEGINLLTGEPTPDPVNALAQVRMASHPLYDLYGKILPVDGDALKASGIKTGGGFGAEMLGRVSPVGTRRFKPLARWQHAKLSADGKWRAEIKLPRFVGEVRVTAVAYSKRATGATSVQRKVSPKLVMMPDAPRFVAPGDRFVVTLPLHNRSGAAGEVAASVGEDVRRFTLAENAATNLEFALTAPDAPGEMKVVYRASGFGETNAETIELPVRPAVAWRESAGVKKVDGRYSSQRGKDSASTGNQFERYSEKVYDSPLGGYEAAIRWLAEYRYGCLEQTCSRVFPLIAAGGILTTIVDLDLKPRPNPVQTGLRRVESMVRENDFVMWPDADYAPWNREVSLYAAHFLIAAEKAGHQLNPSVKANVFKFLKKWAMSKDTDESAYACLVLALAGKPEADRMFRLYDSMSELSALARARLALAFAEKVDLVRAKALLKEAFEPQSVKEAAFQLMARLAVDPRDERIPQLLTWLNVRRDRAKFSWGTTEENAHALLAIGAYYQANPPKPGEKFVAWRNLSLPKLEEVKDESAGLFLTRRVLTREGKEADLMNLRRGELLTVELSITSSVTRVVSDLVIEDLFAGAFDPVHSSSPCDFHRSTIPPFHRSTSDWLLRSDARDDRMLLFSKAFHLAAGEAAIVTYPVRVVSSGEYVLPGPSVEAMYNPELHSVRAPTHIVVK